MAAAVDDELLARAARGDGAALGTLFNAYGPYLRAVVRRRLSGPLRAWIDTDDVVQSVWLRAVRQFRGDGPPPDPSGMRGLLATIAQRRLIDRARRHAARPAEAAPDPDAFPSANQPRPSQEAVADDLWQQMLDRCPAEHHDVLRLRRDGHDLHTIAARTGLHEGSVRRVLRTLARQLALADGPTRGAGEPLR